MLSSSSPGGPRSGASPPRRAWLALGLALVACSGPPGAGRQRGEDLGTYRVQAVEASNTCGPEALGSPTRFEFEVELARADSELFWGDGVGGRVQASLEFELSAQNTFSLRRAGTGNAGCAITREDEVSGRLHAASGGGIEGFSALMTYGFAEAPASACTVEDQQAAGLPLLPCRLEYSLDGARTRAPEGVPGERSADLE